MNLNLDYKAYVFFFVLLSNNLCAMSDKKLKKALERLNAADVALKFWEQELITREEEFQMIKDVESPADNQNPAIRASIQRSPSYKEFLEDKEKAKKQRQNFEATKAKILNLAKQKTEQEY